MGSSPLLLPLPPSSSPPPPPPPSPWPWRGCVLLLLPVQFFLSAQNLRIEQQGMRLFQLFSKRKGVTHATVTTGHPFSPLPHPLPINTILNPLILIQFLFIILSLVLILVPTK